MFKVLSKTLFVLFVLCSRVTEASGQPVLPYDLKKPEKFENKPLGAEKSAEKKFKGPRRFIQNTVTHYNWYFNANNKINEIVERAKLANKDDYSALLPFYNFSLERTAADKTDLDSVIYKTNTGVLIHDLRNAWIDNLYMLMGKAYYYRNDMDSAYKTFQFVNFSFSPKDDGYDLPIGSNANEGGSPMSVSTKENNSLVKRVFSTPPSRNEALIWQIKTYIEKGSMPEAASLIQTLRNDPVFPERLQNDLNEVQAHWFYNEKNYDSAAFYLERALGNASGNGETSRWEYLIAQLYELAKQPSRATVFYERAIRHTLDPVLEVYARLNAIRQNSSDSASIKKNIEQLQKMGRKDRYSKYRDIVYYTAAQIELQRNNIPGAREMLLKSTAASATNLNPAQRTRSFLLLGDLSFQQKMYADAKSFYDSVNNNDPGIPDVPAFEKRKETLTRIVLRNNIIQRQDSLQHLAAMKPAEREALLKKMARQLRRKQGLQEEEPGFVNTAVGLSQQNQAAPDLFGDNANKNEWYFTNASLKSKGLSAFKQTWGNRPNVDNWRRLAEVNNTAAAAKENNGTDDGQNSEGGNAITYESLLKNIPLDPKQLALSQDSVENAMLDLGEIYINDLEEYPAAIDTLEKYCDKFPYSSRKPEALYYLYYAYMKTGKEAKAKTILEELDQKYSGTHYQQQVHNAATGDGDRAMKSMTKAYENVYNLFIEGNFAEALNQKKLNDSIFGSGYWTPQLLYIESVYFLHAREDSMARKTLNSIIDLYPDKPMALKAKNILEVLGRRKEIEDYLTRLEIKRVEDTIAAESPVTVAAKPKVGTPLQQDTTRLLPKKMSLADSLSKLEKPVVKAPPPSALKMDTAKAEPASVYDFRVEAPHSVVVVLTRVDPVYVSESRNAFNRYNMEKYYNTKIDINNVSLNDSVKLVVMSGFDDAAVAREYMQKIQSIAATQIVPWLPAAKYSFILISNSNIEVLKKRQDLDEYRKFQEKYFPKR